MTTLSRRSFLAGIPVAAAAGVLALTAPKALAQPAVPWHQRPLGETPEGRRWVTWLGELPTPVLDAMLDELEHDVPLEAACEQVRREHPEVTGWYRANYSAWLAREPYRGWDRG